MSQVIRLRPAPLADRLDQRAERTAELERQRDLDVAWYSGWVFGILNASIVWLLLAVVLPWLLGGMR